MLLDDKSSLMNSKTIKKAAAFALMFLILSILVTAIFDVTVDAKRKRNRSGSNEPLPTENRGSSSNERKTVLKEYTDMPSDSPLIISSHSIHKGKIFKSATMDIAGEIKNNGTDPADFVQIIATFYDANNVTLGTQNTFTEPTTIESGQSAPYKMTIGFGDTIPVREIDHIKYHIDWQ